MSVTLEPENGGQPIKVRHRVRSGLHILAEATQVRVDFGRHDKIEFAFGADFAERASARPTDSMTLVLADPCDIPTSLKLVEIHWEFQVSDALLAFSAMERWLAVAAPDVIQTRRVDMLYHRSRAARWIKFDARKGITIAVYAKARNRLRLEVRYRGRKGRTIGQILSAERQFTGSTTLIDRLDLLRQEGAESINLLLSHADLTQVAQSAAIAHNFSALLSVLARVPARYRHLLPDVFAQLVASSSVDAIRKSDLFNLCEVLGRFGILKPAKVVARSPSTRFVLIEPHRSAIEAFRTFLSAQADAVATPAEA
jgi:hypothetical protein